MAPPMKTTTQAKHPSSDALDEPPAKRTRHAKSKNTTNDAPIDTDGNEEAPNEPNSTEKGSTRNTSSRSSKTDTDQQVKQETDESESVKPKSPKEGDNEPRVIEKGHAFFFYRPKVDVIDKPTGADDVQKLYMLLSPDDAVGRPATEDMVGQQDPSSKFSHDNKPNHRLLVIPQKSLPSPGKGTKSRIWAFVDEASADLDKVENKLERYSYSTKTRGERTQQSARLIGEARYEIVIHHGHSHFIYELEVPQQPTDVQQTFNISKEGQFLVQVKNPEIQTPATQRGQARYATLGEGAAKLPDHLQEKFRGIRKDWVRYTILDSTEFLDIPHVEIGLFAVNKDVKEEFTELVEALEAEVEEEEKEIEKEGSPEDHVYKELNLDESKVPAALEEFK
ncbi:hypothetical protein BGX34_001088 [Mortierella sp. NVP85]|nr:hypothetical protein BGX34_001088 [Mortierella sp. NVP85]